MDSRKRTRFGIRKRLNKPIPLRNVSKSGNSQSIYKDGRWMVRKVDTASETAAKEIKNDSDTKTQSH